MGSDTQTSLLHFDDDAVVNGVVNYKGQPSMRSKSGTWRSAWFVIGVEVGERFAHYGILSNLITYLTGPLRLSTATAAESINVWAGTAMLLPLVGAFIADSYVGRYRTILLASLVYILGLGLLAVSAMVPSDCQANESESCSPNLQVMLFFISLYMVAIGQGGQKPCIQAFGADQFDEHHPKECRDRSSFFNWCYFGMCTGILLSLLTLNYVKDNISWALGFAIPCLVMTIGLLVFLLGTKTYRFNNIKGNEKKSPFVRIGRVFAAATRNRRISLSDITFHDHEETCTVIPHPCSKQSNFLHKALLAPEGSKEEACSLNEVEEAEAVLRLIPIWAICLIFGIVFAQVPTFFTKQGATMDRTVFPGFDLPAASFQSLVYITIVIVSPIYDCIFVPAVRSITKKPSGITMLQRIGTGLLFTMMTTVIAALVEMKRLKIAREYGVVDDPNATVPMSVRWLIPQYLLFGIAEVFTAVGLQEFFYDQVPLVLKSMGPALYYSIFGLGSFLSSFLISMIEDITGKDGQNSWFANNINQAHLDYFYWLLAGLSTMELVLFIFLAKSYVYN